MSSTSSLYPSIIAVSGKIGTGKDHLVVNVICPYLKSIGKTWQIISFADHLKMLTHSRDKIAYHRLFVKKDTESRRALQDRGTLERAENPNVFIDVLKCSMRLARDRGVDVVIVPDLRYQNEFDVLYSCGAISFRIDAPNRNKDKLLSEANGDEGSASIIASHRSEIDLDGCKDFNYKLNNDYANESDITRQLTEILDSLYPR